MTRRALGWVLPYPRVLRLALFGARLARPLARVLPSGVFFGRVRAMLDLAPSKIPPASPVERPASHPAVAPRRARVALLAGCAQQVLDPDINEATIRLLTRSGVEVVVASGAGCCGALTHHMGQHDRAMASVRANVAAWMREIEAGGLDAIIVNTSGCGTTVKDYGFMARNEPAPFAEQAARVSALAMDVSEFLAKHGYTPTLPPPGLTVAYHSACSLQHGQQIRAEPKGLLVKAGFTVVEPSEPHLCCGSAGTYNIMQPEIAGRLRERKLGNLRATRPDLIAAGNIGCITQLSGAGIPVAHTIQLLDWMAGGPRPAALAATVA
jgi:glycolate oxidase iron-sulfur subunit